MFAKFINRKQIQIAKNPIFQDGKVYSNPTEKTLKNLGYKPLVVEEIPEREDVDVYYIDGEVITQKWEVLNELEG